MSQFEGSENLGGGYFTMVNKNNQQIIIETTNDWFEEYGGYCTQATVYAATTDHKTYQVYSTFIDSYDKSKSIDESSVYGRHFDSGFIAKSLNSIMPYIAERVNKVLKEEEGDKLRRKV